MRPAESAPLPQSRFSAFSNDESHRPTFVKYFGLRENPFRSTSDPRYLLLTRQTRQALDGLITGIAARSGLLVVTGEVGAGKTVLLNRLLDVLRQQGTPRAFIFNSHLETDDLFEMALADFGAPPTPAKPVVRLQHWLLERYRADSNAVLIIDEAQGLKLDVLEAIRMLLNMEPWGEKLLQIVLSGQPEFDAKLNLPELRPLRQRVAVRHRLNALTLEETCLYIEHRLRVAGSTTDLPFEPEALAAIHYYGHGTPRVINALCEQVLMKACAERNRPIPPKTVEEVAFQFQVDGDKPLGTPVELGDLMMINAIAARSKRAKLVPAESAGAGPGAGTSRPELETPAAPASQDEPSPGPLRLPGVAAPVHSAPLPATPVAASAPALRKPVADAPVSPAAAPVAPTVVKEPPPQLIRLLAAVAAPDDGASAPARPVAIQAPLSTGPTLDPRGSLVRTPAPLSTREIPALASRPSRASLDSRWRAQLSLLSLSSIERVASNCVRWLREPMRSNRGATRDRPR
jgi:general secretion pathway protein A